MTKKKNSIHNEGELSKLQTDFDNLKAQSEQLENQLKRAVADYHNLEKRVAEGRSELNNWATEDLIGKILPVMDHLFHAIEGVEAAGQDSAWLQGVRLAALELKKVLEEQGLEVIPAEPGNTFDPLTHEAVDIAEGENDKIVKVAQLGYKLNGKVLRPAKVVVGRKE